MIRPKREFIIGSKDRLIGRNSVSIDQIREERNSKVKKEESNGNCVAMKYLNEDVNCS